MAKEVRSKGVHLGTTVAKTLKDEFARKCARNGVKPSQAIRDFAQEYIRDDFDFSKLRATQP